MVNLVYLIVFTIGMIIPQYESAFYKSIAAMGTRFNVVLPGLSPERAQDVFGFIRSEVLRLEHMLNRFADDSDINLINKKAFATPVKVSDEIFEILELCNSYYIKTNGYFDVTIYPLMRLWNIKHGYKLDIFEPEKDEIDEVLSAIGMNKVILDKEKKTVSFVRKGLEIDLGGFAKGYVIEKVRELLLDCDVKNAFISFGESSLIALGQHPHGDAWEVGIPHLLNKDKLLYKLKLKDQGISNSGTNPTESGFSRFGHIINPRTGNPIIGTIAVTVASFSAIDAEILSTTLLMQDEAERTQTIKTFNIDKAILFEYSETGEVVINELK